MLTLGVPFQICTTGGVDLGALRAAFQPGVVHDGPWDERFEMATYGRVRAIGTVPQAAYELGQEQGYYEANPGSDVAIKQMTLNAPTENSKGLRFGNYVQIRDVIDQEFQALLTGDKTAQQALDDLVSRGNQMLRDFQAANQ